MNIRAVLISTALVLGLSVFVTPPAIACGPSFVLPIFSFDARPEKFEAFAKGNIGIIQPTFFRSALLVSYRFLNNQPFSDAEQQDLIRDWQAEYDAKDANEAIKKTAIDNWVAARKKVVGNEKEPQIYTDRNNPENYSSFLNCTASAFDTAVNTLNNRLESVKPDDAYIKNWLQAQDTVFASCSEGKEIATDVAQDAPDWLKQDRAYQIAAGYFYTMQYDEAKKRFQDIANNKNSPWHETAELLLARISLRQANGLIGDDTQRDKMLALYKETEQQLTKILTNDSLKNLHGAARGLLNMVQFHTQPETLHETLAKQLSDKSENKYLFQQLTDYRRLLDRAVEGYSDEDKALYAKFEKAHDLTDWIFTVQSKEKQSLIHALEKWQATKNTAWLIASLIKVDKDNAAVNDLMTAAKAIEKTSSAYLTAAYHIIRLDIELNQLDEARQLADDILANTKEVNLSAINLILAQRLILSKDVAEFVKFSQRHAVMFGYDASEILLTDLVSPPEVGMEDYDKNLRPWVKRSMFDVDATRMMNKAVPLSVLTQIALSSDLPDYLRSRVVLSAWMRAMLLDNEAVAKQLTPELAKLIPELKSLLAAYDKAKPAKAKSYEAVWCMLKNPAMRPLVDTGMGRSTAFNEIENFRDNWWCNVNYFEGTDDSTAKEPIISPVFLTQDEKAKAKEENAKIEQIAPSGSDFIAIKTVEWAEFAPKDKRLPEALALAVKSTRYGCDTCSTTKVSKAAFSVLGSRYANTEWKKKTPYWFKGVEECNTKQ